MSKKWRKGKLMSQQQPPTSPSVTQVLETPPAPTALQPQEQADLLWKVIGRFDFYINTVNTKATFLIAFNTFMFSAIILKWVDLMKPVEQSKGAVFFGTIFFAIAAIAALTSLAFTFGAINPFLKSPEKAKKYHSRLFFEHVAKHEKPEEYLGEITSCTRAELVEDLASQAHSLAEGTSNKFRWIKLAVKAVLVELAALLLLVLIQLGVVIYNHLQRGVGG